MTSPKESIVKVRFRIPKEHLNRIKEIAKIKRVSLNSLFLSAIEFYINEGGGKGGSEQYLLSLSQSMKNLKVDSEIIAEMLSFFVMHYFCYTPELPEAQKKALFLSGKTRHAKFMENLGKRVQSRGSSFTHLLSDFTDHGEKSGVDS